VRIERGTGAVVTGAGSGLGRALASALAAKGAIVVVSDLEEATARETAGLIAAAGGTAHVVGCDVASADAVARLADAATSLVGDVDVVVNNAGIGAAGPVGVAPLAAWQRVIDVNLWGVIHGCHYFVPAMRARRRGHVLNVASAAGLVSAPGLAPYNVTKAGVVALSETLAAEVAGDGVGVTVLCPGFFRTNIMERAIGEIDAGQRRFVEAEMARSRHDADAVARFALDAVERGRLYALPHGEIRWAWRVKRLVPALFARITARLERRGFFSTPR
jgi:NAD(P)-dependent dehydrogenase (short-subunit alcohol dehydrogenase family)